MVPYSLLWMKDEAMMMCERSHKRTLSRKRTPWDEVENRTETQEYLRMHYLTRYEQRHPKRGELDEAVMVNSYVPSRCPFCESTTLSMPNENVTIKGGVVMHNISKDMRRATRDMDIDFIKYSLEDRSIREFIKELNNTDDGIKIKITGKIEPLHHQDYDGKRVYIQLTDKNRYSISSKLDI